LRDKYYKQRSITNFEHSMGSDLEGISKFLDYCPIIGGVKQTLEGIIGTTMSGELINDLEAKNMVVMGIFSTGIDLIPLGSILKSCNTVKSLVVSVTKDIVTSEAIGYTNSFMASCGAPPSSLIIMNLLATSVFTHYNKVSPIKDLDGTPHKVNSDNIADAMSIKGKVLLGDKLELNTNKNGTLNEIDITPNKALLGESHIGCFQDYNGNNGADTLKYKSTSGVDLVSNPEKTTTVLGRYDSDTKNIIQELGVQKNTDFSGNKGGFNLLNTPDELYKTPKQFWDEYNKPFLDYAISRGDDILMSTPINNSTLYTKTGELTGYGKEYFYLNSKGYEYLDGKMILKGEYLHVNSYRNKKGNTKRS
ncbi:MAG: hypothetical protein RR646_00005, partial [Erysipelotrichaceae bacterium]